MTQKNLNLYRMKHFLSDAKNLTMTGLSVVTSEDISEYTYEYNSNVEPNWKTDIATEKETQTTIINGVVALYGSYGKEHKYVMRCRDKQTSRISTHYNKYLTPNELQTLIDDSKSKMDSLEQVSTVGLDNKTMDNVDDAISFLITQGYTYGVDFSSHNAVDIAMSLASSTLGNLISKDSISIKECDDCGNEDHEWYERDEQIVISCNCKSIVKNVSFKDGQLTLTSNE